MTEGAVGVRVREKVAGSGVWWVFIAKWGQRVSRRVGDKTLAEQVALEVGRRLLRAGRTGSLQVALAEAWSTAVPVEELTVAQYAAKWQKVKGADWAPRTYALYESNLRRHILPAFGHLLLKDVSKHAVKDWVAGVAKHPTTRRNVHRVFASMMSEALEDELIEANPVTRRQLPRVKPVERPLKAWTRDQLRRIVAAADRLSTRDRCMLEILIDTGMRISEACGLKWGDFDTREGHVLIQRQFATGKIRECTKNHSFRTVPISPAVLARLRGHRAGQERAAVKAGVQPTEWVFATLRGNPLGSNNYREEVWKKRVLRRSGVPDYGLHGFRHTWASHALKKMRREEVSRRLGHSEARTTALYSHFIEDETTSAPFNPLIPDVGPGREGER